MDDCLYFYLYSSRSFCILFLSGAGPRVNNIYCIHVSFSYLFIEMKFYEITI
jgi:hypothetical protein